MTPCGMICDYLRSCYTTKMRFFGDDLDRLSEVKWYFCRPDAQILPYYSKFASGNWNQGGDAPTVPTLGEDRSVPRRYYKGDRIPPDLGQATCTPRAKWENGCGTPGPIFDPVICCSAVHTSGGPLLDGTGLPVQLPAYVGGGINRSTLEVWKPSPVKGGPLGGIGVPVWIPPSRGVPGNAILLDGNGLPVPFPVGGTLLGGSALEVEIPQQGILLDGAATFPAPPTRTDLGMAATSAAPHTGLILSNLHLVHGQLLICCFGTKSVGAVSLNQLTWNSIAMTLAVEVNTGSHYAGIYYLPIVTTATAPCGVSFFGNLAATAMMCVAIDGLAANALGATGHNNGNSATASTGAPSGPSGSPFYAQAVASILAIITATSGSWTSPFAAGQSPGTNASGTPFRNITVATGQIASATANPHQGFRSLPSALDFIGLYADFK